MTTASWTARQTGSPPRMRGKEFVNHNRSRQSGITPAYAGKSLACRSFLISHRDHPRVCGEKKLCCSVLTSIIGSPPRMRGKESSTLMKNMEMRITPAYAGKSLPWSSSAKGSGDHPRVCGEKITLSRIIFHLQGSPPRMRGKVDLYTLPAVRPWITPAYAGKRLKRSHSIGHFSCILCLFHSVLHRASVSGGSRAGPCAPPCLPAQNAVPV